MTDGATVAVQRGAIGASGQYKSGWEKIGFHRAIGGFFFNYIPAIFSAIVLIILNGMLMPQLLPFPDAKGYSEVAKSMYALMFLVFDAGIGSAIGRFVPEYRVKDPKRALQYLSFFVWFQMFTGLVQVTAIAIYVLNWMPANTLHLAWIFLVYSTVQYPGMLSVMYSALKSFQHYGKYIIAKFFQDIFEFSTQAIFILLGRAIGVANPAIGELLGMGMGLVLGLYIDDFLSFIMTAKLLDKVLKDIGLDVGTCLRPTFSRAIAKESLVYGLKTMPAGLYGSALGFFGFLITFSNLPQYAAWLGLTQLIKPFTSQIVDLPGTIKDNADYSIAESFNNGKLNLSRYYIAMTIKWRFFLSTFLGVTVIILIPIAMKSMLEVFGENWLPALPLVPLVCISPLIRVFEMPVSFTKLGHPGYDQAIGIASSTANFLFYAFLIYGIRVELTVTLFLLKDIPLQITFIAIQWIVLDRKLIPVKPRRFVVQAVILALPTTAAYALFCVIYGEYVFPLGSAALGDLPFALLTIALTLFAWPALIVCPIMGFSGAWDQYSIESFNETVKISGPSKWMLNWMYRMTKACYDRSPLKGKFPILGAEDAAREAGELEAAKRARDLENLGMA
ncbi:MAG: hypothetical protein JW839_19445 [Candidatus Lokiarchaeota archaeon]|nr:hypothetical protein [Candidatus Lokiarchaeota archaeon]